MAKKNVPEDAPEFFRLVEEAWPPGQSLERDE